MRVPLRVERHHHGPRVYLLGRRVHEWQVGGAALLAVVVGLVSDLWRPRIAMAIALFAGLWLVVKDWRDLFARTRDTGVWTLGIHRRALALRNARRADWLPSALGIAAAVVGAVNVASALTPNARWRDHLIAGVEPTEAVPAFHALALPFGAALIVIGVYLAKRRRRAWQAALVVLAALGVFNLLKGFDVEEALLGWGLAGVLIWGRDAFCVCHDPITSRSAAWRVPATALVAVGLSAVAVWASAPQHPTPSEVARETGALLLWRSGPMRFHDEFTWLPVAVGIIGVTALLTCAYVVFRPLAAPRALPDPELRRLARGLVRAHGADTLAFFKLREDVDYLFSSDRRAFVAFRVEGGVLLLAGDPVGARDALPDVLREVVMFAERRGLRIGGVGATEGLLPLYEQAGLRALYIGDEAIVETDGFSLEGHAIKKARQAVRRLERAGYRSEILPFEEVSDALLVRLRELSETWREGEPERGFSMAMDSLGGEHQRDSIVVQARDGDGEVRGFLHLVPTYGRPAMSLSFMRRERDTPNGLTEFMVVRAIEGLRAQGVREVSLNFAAFARFMQRPQNRFERSLGRLLSLANPFFQIESLYRFNAKFAPRWEPRYLLYERTWSLARTGLAAMWAEGQLPKLRVGAGAAGKGAAS
jgi:lysyl-tRNA synthetase class 2